MRRHFAQLAAAALLVVSSGCGLEVVNHSDSGFDGGVSDSGVGDGGAGGGDSGVDGGLDAGTDAGLDAGVDAGTDAGTPQPPFDAGNGNISIYVRGDLTPKSFADGNAGQTPSVQVMGVSRLDLMRSSSDPAPVTAFDHADSPALVDMLSPNASLVARVQSSNLPPGTYLYGRALMTLARVTVDATAHLGSFNPPGKLTITSALSDTTVAGVPWVKGRTEYEFLPSGSANPVAFSGFAPPLPNASGATVVQEPHRTWLVFPLSAPFIIDPLDTSPRSATIHYEIYKSFRWMDQSSLGYATDVFDLGPITMDAEPVRNFGATGYHTTSP